MNHKNPHQTIEDAILVGLLKALGCNFTPVRDEFTGKVLFEVSGDVDGALEQIYKNESCGSLDALQAIKSARQAIFSLKGNGYGRSERNFNR